MDNKNKIYDEYLKCLHQNKILSDALICTLKNENIDNCLNKIKKLNNWIINPKKKVIYDKKELNQK